MAGASARTYTTLAQPAMLERGDAVTGALPAYEPMQVVIGLRLRHKDVLDVFVTANARGQALGFAAQAMTSERILADHAPTAEQAGRVASWLESKGYRQVKIARNRMLVTAEGTARTARDAFLTPFERIHTHDGRIAFANADAVRIPTDLADTVQSVLGLQTVHVARTFVRTPPGFGARSNATTDDATTESILPNWLASIYGTSGFPGLAKTPVGIFAHGDISQVLLDLQASYGKLRSIPVEVVETNGHSGQLNGLLEYEMDSQVIAAMSGQAFTSENVLAGITFYVVPGLGNSNLTANFNTIVSRNEVKVINVSLGECELYAGAEPGGDNSAATDDAILELGVAQGQTFVVANGDFGADECPYVFGGPRFPAAYPASSPYVVAVAGTTLTVDDDGTGHGPGPRGMPTYVGETVWPGSGGSESVFEPKPMWQTSWSGSHRAVADVSFDADERSGVTIAYDCNPLCQQLPNHGGTSLSAPIFTALWASLLTAKGNNDLGFAGPVLYALPARDFRDITVGDNGGYGAQVGYDLASGRGSLIFGSQLLADATHPSHLFANFSYVASALAAHFTDTSTDDGAVVSHAWSFGDGSTSGAASPTHIYAATGDYSVREKVEDSWGFSASRTRMVSIAAAPTELLKNGGFETGTAMPWSMDLAALRHDPAHACSGAWYARLGGTRRGDQLGQRVEIPGSYRSARLGFQLGITTAEADTSAKDYLRVSVYDTGGKRLATLGTWSNLDALTGYGAHTFDMTPYIGRTVVLRFETTAGGMLPTSWSIDDVSLAAFVQRQPKLANAPWR